MPCVCHIYMISFRSENKPIDTQFNHTEVFVKIFTVKKSLSSLFGKKIQKMTTLSIKNHNLF